MISTLAITTILRRHMPAILKIESDNFARPWTEKIFTQKLRGRNKGIVALLNNDVAGYAIYESGAREIEIANITVCASARRQGIGRALIAGIMQDSKNRPISLVVRESNLTGQLFFRSCNFKAVKVLRKWFEDIGEDGYQMELKT